MSVNTRVNKIKMPNKQEDSWRSNSCNKVTWFIISTPDDHLCFLDKMGFSAEVQRQPSGPHPALDGERIMVCRPHPSLQEPLYPGGFNGRVSITLAAPHVLEDLELDLKACIFWGATVAQEYMSGHSGGSRTQVQEFCPGPGSNTTFHFPPHLEGSLPGSL